MQATQRESDKSFTANAEVRVGLCMVQGALSWRAEAIRFGIARPWQRLAGDCCVGLWPVEVALLLPRN